MENKESFKNIVDELVLSRNELIDKVYEIDSSLHFLKKVTTNFIESETNLVDFSNGFSNLMENVAEKLMFIINNYDEKFEDKVQKIFSKLSELRREELEKYNFDIEINFSKK